MNCGSCFLAEMVRMISSFSPLGIRSASISVTKPHLYSCSARSRMVLTFVLIALSRTVRFQFEPGCRGCRERRQTAWAESGPTALLSEGATDDLIDEALIVFDRAGRLQVANAGYIHGAFGESQRTFQRGHDFRDRDQLRIACQTVAPLDAAM